MTAVFALIGRALLGLIFLISGVSKIGNFQSTAAQMAGHGIPSAEFFLFGAIIFEVVGGLSVMTGYRAKIGTILLMCFLVPATYLFHFKPAFDANFNVVDQMQMISTMKNLSIFGGLLFVFAQGPGKLALGKN